MGRPARASSPPWKDSGRAGAAAALRSAAGSAAFEPDDLLSAWYRRGHFLALGEGGPRGRLSTLAVAVQLAGFTKVKEMMDTMVAELKKQQAEEVTFKGYCATELDETEKTTYNMNESKKLQSNAEAGGSLSDASSTMKEDQKYLADLPGTCGQKTSDFEQRQQLRAEELQTIH